jgi:hypothetical protein
MIKAKKAKRPGWVPPETDLRGITRRPETCRTVIYLCDYLGHAKWRWIILGEVEFRSHDRNGQRHYISAYMSGGATDFEHDSAVAFQLPVLGLKFEGLWHHTAHFSAIVDPLHDEQGDEVDDMTNGEFRVPGPGYDPTKLPGATTCDYGQCQPHPIVPEGHYLPPHDRKLHEAVAGRYIEIHVGVARDE